MKSLQIVEPGHAELVELPVPEPGPGQVVVKVLAVTTCPHWDMHIFRGKPMFPGESIAYPYMPGQPGHEACGEVAAVGEGVASLTPGQRVCAWHDRGHHLPGCYAQYVLVEESDLIPMPDAIPPASAAPLELAMCVGAHMLYAMKLDAVRGKRVGVFGLGPAGLVAVQLARIEGAAEVIGFDPLPERRALAATCGATRCLDPASEDARSLPSRNETGALDCAFDCVGAAPVVQRAMEVTRELVVLFAVQREPYVFEPRFWPVLTLAGTRPHTREAAEYAARHMASGALDLGCLVTHALPLSEYVRAVELLEAREATKVAFLPWED